MQSYPAESRPQYGWGEFLASMLDSGNDPVISHREGCAFSQERMYETDRLIVDNCAMAGRSTRSFIAEGRLSDIEERIGRGDFLIIQFSHNDANEQKAERYVSLGEFPKFLGKFVTVARNAGAVPILVSPIALCRNVTDSGNDSLIAMGQLLKQYGAAMKEYAERERLAFIDLQMESEALQDRMIQNGNARAGCAALYREDLVHLREPGARAYAGIAAERIRKMAITEAFWNGSEISQGESRME